MINWRKLGPIREDEPDEWQESQAFHFSANTTTKKPKQEKDHLDDIPNNDRIPLTDDNDKYLIKYSECRSADNADEDVNNTPNNLIIPAELISHLETTQRMTENLIMFTW